MLPLRGLTAVITRPLEQAQNLYQQLQAAGANPILFPTLEIIAIADKKPLLAVLNNLHNFAIAIFISANAVTKTMPYWPKTKLKLQVLAVGAATARALADFDIPVITYPEQQFNSEGLLAMPELQQVQNKQIVLFAGEGGRDKLFATLKQRGAQVTKAIVYRRQCPQVNMSTVLPVWQQKQINIIISTSNESLQNLWNLVAKVDKDWLPQQQLLVMSERMADFAHELGFKKPPLVASNASDEAILQALVAWYT